MKKTAALPERVEQHGRWYRITIARKHHKLSPVRDGLPAAWAAYRKFLSDGAAAGDGQIPAAVASWQAAVMVKHAPKTRYFEQRYSDLFAERFADFRCEQPEPPDVTEFLSEWNAKHRMFNRVRSLVRELFRFFIERGLRKAGTNPVDGIIKTKPEPPRDRCPTTSELRRVKVAGLRGNDGVRTRSGPTLACLIELAYLSGQDIGVMVRLLGKRDPQQPDEPHVFAHGVFFRRDKTGGAVEIEWTPRLHACIAALRRIKAERLLKLRTTKRPPEHDCLFTRQDGSPMTYEAASNAWQRAIKRSGVAHFMFRDIRARAMTDKEDREGIAEANKMGTHTTEAQTADYVRRKRARRTKATA